MKNKNNFFLLRPDLESYSNMLIKVVASNGIKLLAKGEIDTEEFHWVISNAKGLKQPNWQLSNKIIPMC